MPEARHNGGMKVAVVGAGICGSSAARYIAIKGHDVALFEQFGLGHDLGSSHGNSRIVRKAYPDAFYTHCMTQAYPLWAELERHADQRLLHEVGLLYFGDGVDSLVLNRRFHRTFRHQLGFGSRFGAGLGDTTFRGGARGDAHLLGE